jgi:hypothetical protein
VEAEVEGNGEVEEVKKKQLVGKIDAKNPKH